MQRIALLILCGCAGSSWVGPANDHFDGEHFLNQPAVHVATFSDLLDWQLHRDHGAWPSWVDDPVQPPPTAARSDEIKITWVGHASMLVQIGSFNVLTDPVWSDRVGVGALFGPKRVRAPGIAFEALPRIDAVVVSHNHYDHLDLPTLKRLAAPIFVGLGNAQWLKREGVKDARELDWGQSVELAGLRITGAQSQHFSRRGLDDAQKSLWMAWVVEANGRRVYFAGDTGYGPHFKETQARYSRFDVALLPIGAYLPRWFMKPQHMDPAEAMLAASDLNAVASVAMHFDTFDLADEAFGQAPNELKTQLREKRSALDFRVPSPGVALSF